MYQKLHLRIRGEVHGVGFRDFVAHEARERSLSGWVRNREDDSVELEVLGAQTPVEDFFEHVKCGPEGCVVADIEDEWDRCEKCPDGEFEIRDTK